MEIFRLQNLRFYISGSNIKHTFMIEIIMKLYLYLLHPTLSWWMQCLNAYLQSYTTCYVSLFLYLPSCSHPHLNLLLALNKHTLDTGLSTGRNLLHRNAWYSDINKNIPLALAKTLWLFVSFSSYFTIQLIALSKCVIKPIEAGETYQVGKGGTTF